jgi:hypothetical protein
MTVTNIGETLARLGGANLTVLAKVESARGRFIQMGLVLLSTAGLAVLSMSFAMTTGLHEPWWVAIPVGLGWGFVIINLDRLLIQHMKPGATLKRAIAMVVPRILIASLLGIVIATPLVLQIFQPEIAAEMSTYNLKQQNSASGTVKQSYAAQQLKTVTTQIETDKRILAGDVPNLTTPNVQAAQTALTQAQTNLTAKQKTAQQDYYKMVCELDGSHCSGASGKVGPGPRYQALKRQYNTAEDDAKDAQKAVASAQTALTAAQKAASKTTTTEIAQAQTNARTEMPGLVARQTSLQKQVNDASNAVNSKIGGDTGILAQIGSLDRLGQKNSSAFWTHWAVAGLLFMIELLPVSVKFLTVIAPPTLYDRVSDLADDTVYDSVVSRRNEDRRKIEQDSKKQRDIEDDMRTREVRLALKANAHVAGEMEKILDLALAQWSDQVTRTLHQGSGAVPLPASAGGSGAAGAAAGSGANGSPINGTVVNGHDAAIRGRFGLPGGGAL